MPADYLVLIHGITPTTEPDPLGPYERLLARLFAYRPELVARFPAPRQIRIVWGLPPAVGPAEDDEWLHPAEVAVRRKVRFAAVEEDDAPENVLHGGVFGRDLGVLGLRSILGRLREDLVLLGLADAVYYASPDGESRVRAKVFDAVLRAIRPTVEETDGSDGVARLHVVAHSLGVTVAHDFLYGLFGKRGPSDYVRSRHGDAACQALYRTIADRRRDPGHVPCVTLGSFVAMASQLPLFMMRKQRLVERLAKHGKPLDPVDIGITSDDVTWKTFYDVDDVLAFATRPLYAPTPAIVDVQVDNGDLPMGAHTGYWDDPDVARNAADLIAARSGG